MISHSSNCLDTHPPVIINTFSYDFDSLSLVIKLCKKL